MTDADKGPRSWVVTVSGTRGKPEDDKLTVTRHDPPRVFLEIIVPGLRSVEMDQRLMGREAIQRAITALQGALESPTELDGFLPD